MKPGARVVHARLQQRSSCSVYDWGRRRRNAFNLATLQSVQTRELAATRLATRVKARRTSDLQRSGW
jgi:hypothetical protein